MSGKLGLWLLLLFLSLHFSLFNGVAQAHEKAKHKAKKDCPLTDVKCATTVTAKFAPDGRLWRLYSHQNRLIYSISTDQGKHFGAPVVVDSVNEKISARGENRPKIGFDAKGQVFLSWAKPLSKRFTADVRFSYSVDGGKTFAKPITVNQDNLLTGHSFNEMVVSRDSTVTITWLDGRKRFKDKSFSGSSLFSATGQLIAGKIELSEFSLADNTCVCCRISMSAVDDDQVAVMWRHIYGDNYRDHGFMRFKGKQITTPAVRATFDHWQINGCPHQGPGLSYQDNRLHTVWYNQGEVKDDASGQRGSGIFYSQLPDGESQLLPQQRLADLSDGAGHPHVVSTGQRVDVVWTGFVDGEYLLLHRSSADGGKSFAPKQVLARSKTSGDRAFLLAQGQRVFVSWHRPLVEHSVIAL